MNILMMTNTYLPHVGGVARSVETFSRAYRRRGHRVTIVAPEFEGMPEHEPDVIRIPAIQRFNGSDFSVVLPIPNYLGSEIERFKPDIVHSHHPFLIGSTATRIAGIYRLPLVFTHHTMYEQYTHYVPGNSETLKRFVTKLATSYANICDQVFAPSESVAGILRERGVQTPLEVIPTGVDVKRFAQGSGPGFRAAINIPDGAFVIGHVGRLAPEKNLEFLSTAVLNFIKTEPRAHFLLVGKGPSEQSIQKAFAEASLTNRLHHAGQLQGPMLVSAYRAMDGFVFCSKSETQGMVLVEAMAAGVPVIALDAPGAREVVIDRENGMLLPANSSGDRFTEALRWLIGQPEGKTESLKRSALKTAEQFSVDRCVDKALAVYADLAGRGHAVRENESGVWSNLLPLIKAEWDILKGYATAAGDAMTYDKDNEGG